MRRLELMADENCENCKGRGRRIIRKRTRDLEIGEPVHEWRWCECVTPAPYDPRPKRVD